ncbi:DUF4157 domain-containing protein [Streptomyces sp. MNU89]|uniref:eCIS core domain-containing protein n=1 Tax=Streptomyces sp. MNU89 TaxID=2560025 RepID=UPI001E31566A|nr:DUF4157 domain-containing protein [Streptomyces sp. MNU89]MCC9739850.1 DUF4157 domain-containing protein [Streptomyces sp. MNU89]
MSSHASQDSSAEAARNAKRRKRTERSAKNTAPEPKDIVSGAGQPLDLSVRRELEERLGHDFSRVRLHTDRDADVLTGLMGADAVAVGQDIFFREGAYHPGTAEGQRLLAHELLHTVQNPDGLGALRAGRDLGAVSLPEQTVEREAESAARAAMGASVRAAADADTGAVTGTGTTAGVEPGRATPGWLRYATVDADRRRMELIDPATLTDRVANGLLRSLRGDPADRSKRVRLQLAQMSDNLRDAVLDRLERRLLSPEFDRIAELVEETAESGPLERGALDAPEAVPDPAELLADDRERERERAETERENGHRTEPPEEERQTPDGTPVNRDGETAGPEDGTGTPHEETDPGGETERPPEEPREEERPEPPVRQPRQPEQPRPEPWRPRPAPAGSGSGGARSGGGTAGRPSGGGTSTGGSRAPSPSASAPSQARPSGGGGGAAEEGGGQAGLSGARAPSKEESAAKNRPGAVEPLVAGQQVPQRDKKEQDGREPGTESAEQATTEEQPENLSRLDGMRFQDRAGGPAPRAEEEPARAPDAAETAEPGPLEDPDSAWNTELKPEDFLPATDLDVSGVPTADQLVPGQTGTPPAPSFPDPPPTRAEEVRKRREEEDAAEAEAEERAAAPVTEGTEDAAADGAGGRGRGGESGPPGGPGGFSAAVTAPSRDRESERSGGVEPLAVRTAAETEREHEAARTAGEQQEKDTAGAGAAGAGTVTAEAPADSPGVGGPGSPNAATQRTGPQSAAARPPRPRRPHRRWTPRTRHGRTAAPHPGPEPRSPPGGTPEPSPAPRRTGTPRHGR